MKSLTKYMLFFAILTVFSIDLCAQTKLSVQGVIRRSDGNAVDDGIYPITFKLYDAETGGTELWTETQTNVKVTSGIYSTLLGIVTPLNLQFDVFYYLSLTVDGEELLPRAPLTSAPYSNSVLGFDNVFPSTGDVGIGTLNPQEKVDIAGNLKVDSIFADGELYVNNIHTAYRGTFLLTGLASGADASNYRQVTIPAVPASYVGDAASLVLVVCSYGSSGKSAMVMQASVLSPTVLGLYIYNVTGNSTNTYRFNYTIFPMN